jgi:transposase
MVSQKRTLPNNLEAGLTTANLDHHGLVAAICKDLKIAQRIDKRLPVDPNRKVSPGQGTVAMILNGLGYTNRTLYMSHHFFSSKPIERLIGPSLKAEDITNYTLAHTLDDISAYGSSKLFMEVAMEIAIENDLLGLVNHLDTTSFSLEGSYKNQEQQPGQQEQQGPKGEKEQEALKEQEEGEEPSQVITVTHGYSKDHRPDLKQVILSLVVNGPSAIPICMEPLSGNSSDKTSLHQSINQVERFKKQIELDKPFKWVADSALYTRDKLLKDNSYTWLTRVPETIKEARELLEKDGQCITWQNQEKGYKTSSHTSHYGGIEQRWMLVYSSQSYDREKERLDNKLKKDKKQLEQKIWHLSKQVFGCSKDGEKAVKELIKKQEFLEINYEIEVVKGYLQRGKPKQGEEIEIKGYQIKATVAEKKEAISKVLNRKGRFILATNDLNKEGYTDQAMLEEYKDQQKVEGGFRFLKDPWFMVDSIYLKLPRRIESLMMLMSLTLLVYNVGQYRIRQELEKRQESMPNQLGKEIQTPTLRWIFQIMEGIGIIYLGEELTGRKRQSYISNITPLRARIIRLCGSEAETIYGLSVKEEVA